MFQNYEWWPCWYSKQILWEFNSFLVKLTISCVHINLHKRWPPDWPEGKRSINISTCVPVFVYQVYLLTSSIFDGVNYLHRCYLCFSFNSATCYNVKNCTSPTNGICRRRDECRCHDGYIGKEGLNRSVKDRKAAYCAGVVHVYIGTDKKEWLVIQWVQNLRVEATAVDVCDGKGALIRWFSISLCLKSTSLLCSFKFDFMHAESSYCHTNLVIPSPATLFFRVIAEKRSSSRYHNSGYVMFYWEYHE